MRSDHPPAIHLADYRAPDFLVDHVDMLISLDAAATRIVATLSMRRNPAGSGNTPVVLDGDELQLKSLLLNGAPVDAGRYTVQPDKLVLADPPEQPFTLTIETALDAPANRKLMGLYLSNGIYCTQCEAEGFRRITYFPDRPDILSTYRVRLEASKQEAPALLGNGNLVSSGGIDGTGRHFAVWDDPFRKPCYLFAVIGGDLDRLSDGFTTRGGRKVDLGIYVERGKTGQAAYAMDALKRSMKWDEDVFGCEYDLDVFNIAAVSHFNFGAMENKGLNIFNDKYVLASPNTATDSDYANIEAIIAHEYFHNWTGNRITCRDWFQLCLKEGLTVFRDQEFSSDMRSRPVKRISDARNLKTAQFAEDSGPLAHPVRPASYREINNFYTVTIYEKGAEVIRMLKALTGEAAFKRGMDLYFQRCDGTAATMEDFIACFAEASGRDLSQFMRWYDQAGTPQVRAAHSYDAASRTLTLSLTQSTPATPGQDTKAPFVIPIRLGLISSAGQALAMPGLDGSSAAEAMIVLDSREATFVFGNVEEQPVPSLLRGFSAPVKLRIALTRDELLTLARFDTDPFNRWQALQELAMRHLVQSAGLKQPAPADPVYLAVFAEVIGAAASDPAFAAQCLTLPGEADIALEIGADVDPAAIAAARKALRRGIGARHLGALLELHGELAKHAAFQPNARDAGRRQLCGIVLDLLCAADAGQFSPRAKRQFDDASNMTDRLNALAALCQAGGEDRERALAAFEQRYASDALVMDKWFAAQAAIPDDGVIARIERLMGHAGFTLTNPNRVRSLIGAFAAGNLSQFHRPDGQGYALAGRVIQQLDPLNPQVAARLLTAFRSWRSLEPVRRAMAKAALEAIAATAKLSPDTRDILDRTLA